MNRSGQKLVTIYSTKDRIDVMMVKSMLDEAGMSYSINGEAIQELGVIFEPILVQVLEEDVASAREILQPLIEREEIIDEETLIALAEQSTSSDV